MKRRNYGIDLLRIVAMYMIVLYHCLLLGGVLLKQHSHSSGKATIHSSIIMELLILVMILIVALPEEWEIIPHHQGDPVAFLVVVLVDLVVALVVEHFRINLSRKLLGLFLYLLLT